MRIALSKSLVRSPFFAALLFGTILNGIAFGQQEAGDDVKLHCKLLDSRPVKIVRPVYPGLAKETRVQGRVSLMCIVGKDGAVEKIEVKSGHPLLIRAAVDAVSQWRFKPLLLNGEPAEVETTANIDFQLPKVQKTLAPAKPDLPGNTPQRVVHIFVALADNQHQGIIPVPVVLGNGDDPARNLYWGAAFGVRTFFRKSPKWRETLRVEKPYRGVLERIVFQHTEQNVVIVADAYRGSEIKQALTDFLSAAAGNRLHQDEPKYCAIAGVVICPPEDADLAVYVGHDGLMDFSLDKAIPGADGAKRSAIVLACASKQFFGSALKATGARPLLWTTGLMAPEAYTLEAALDGWILGESEEQIRYRAASAYAQYQKCSLAAALRLFSTTQ